MTQVFIGKLPHGKISVQTVADQPTREMAMLVVENQVAHEKRTRTLERAMLEVQKKPSGTGSEELDRAVAKAKEYRDTALTAKTDAGNSATAAAASAVLAANANIIAFRVYGKDIGENAGTKTFYLADFGLSDSSKTYLVTATFTNESETARYVTLNGGGTSGTLSGGVGKRCVLRCTVAGGGSFDVDNIATSVNVVICIKINS